MKYANKRCSAAKGFFWGALILTLLPLGCGAGAGSTPAEPVPTTVLDGRRFQVFTRPAAANEEHTCAWYGAAHDEILYFGEAAFWNAARRTGKPTGDLETKGPQHIGRFRLAPQPEMLPPIQLDHARPSGVWDVLPHAEDRLYFTTFFESAGYVDLKNNRVHHFGKLGTGLNEWATGPDDSLLVSRYAGGSAELGGTVVQITPDGELMAELSLRPGERTSKLAPKTVAWDPLRGEIWVTTDVIPQRTGADAHPTLILDLAGEERLRIQDFEVQYVRFDHSGTGYLALAEGSSLVLGIVEPGPAPLDLDQLRRVLLNPAFHSDLDFAQDVKLAPDGRIVITTWGGAIYLVDPDRGWKVDRLAFPRLSPGGLYYSAVLAGERLCATYCADVSVVCTDLE